MPLRLVVSILFAFASVNAQSFVSSKGPQLILDGNPYHFVGTNYWYGSLLGGESVRKRGVERLRKDLDFLRSKGVTNLRLLAGAEGVGLLNGVPRVGPPLQPQQGVFDVRGLDGLDIVLAEMTKRRMKAVIFFSNNWEWSGGFQQYLIWNNVISDRWLSEKPDWDQLRDLVAKFYSCDPCKAAYAKQVAYVLGRTNKITGIPYVDDPTIFAWQIANEPRPMRPSSNNAYSDWIAKTAAQISSKAPNQLVSIGHEGWVGTQDIKLYEKIHADPNIDYLTIHIWPKNWAWFANGKMSEGYAAAEAQTAAYITEHTEIAKRLGKPLVVEEFGLPRDGQAFSTASTTHLRDRYFDKVLSFIGTNEHVAGANFWAFGGRVRPKRLVWKPGDEYTGDPPMEEQGLYSVFTFDRTTWKTISRHTKRLGR